MKSERATPVHRHSPIKMRRVADFDHVRNVGDFYWDEQHAHRSLCIMVPGTDDGRAFVSAPTGPRTNGVDGWQWNGDRDQPTLRPSLHVHGEWHGFVRRGFLIEAS